MYIFKSNSIDQEVGEANFLWGGGATVYSEKLIFKNSQNFTN